MLQEMPTNFSNTPIDTRNRYTWKTLTLTTNSWHQHIYMHARSISSWVTGKEYASQGVFFFVLGILIRNCKTRKLLLPPWMYRHIFSFTLKSIATLLQKLAIFYASNVKHNDDSMDQKTLHCCNGDYVTTCRDYK